MARIAINGFGRIGRCILRAAVQRNLVGLEFVAVNDLTEPETLAHLLKYDSVHGTFEPEVRVDGDTLIVGDLKLAVSSVRDPSKLPWKDLEIDLVMECTGRFRSHEDASLHLEAGAKRVLISAPAKGDPDMTIVYGVNQELFKPEHVVLSNASCTTNCLSPMVKVLIDNFGWEQGLMTTIHSFTNNQRILDLPHKDLRRARAASVSMIPTTTGAAIAVSRVIPEVEGKLHGMAVRVPIPCVSLTDLTAMVKKSVTREAVNDAFRAAAAGPLKGVLAVSDVPLVSIDFTNNPHSCVIDSEFTHVNGHMVKILGWYDNEWGFSNRMLDVSLYTTLKG